RLDLCSWIHRPLNFPQRWLRYNFCMQNRALACTVAVGMLMSSRQVLSQVHLPSGATIPRSVVAGQPVNSFPAAIAVSPDKRFAVVLNNGYGIPHSKSSQSLTVLELASGKTTDFPDVRLRLKARQTYFYGLAFSRDGKRVYASFASESDPRGEKEH